MKTIVNLAAALLSTTFAAILSAQSNPALSGSKARAGNFTQGRAATASTSQVNAVGVAGGGSARPYAADSTTIVAAAGGNSYSTAFPLAENPISEGGNWSNGKANGFDWADVQTAPGQAHGTETGAGGFDDSTAILTGSWGPDQTVQATYYRSAPYDSGTYEEVELRLRTSISAHSITGYEVLWQATDASNGYAQVVRWNGAAGDFTYVDPTNCDRNGPGLTTGDVVTATISGSTITAYVNGAQIMQCTDATYTTGNPGIGFYLQGPGANANYGFSSFSATGGSTTLSPQTITFGALSDVSFGVAPFAVSATASSGLAVSLASTTPSVCTVSGNTVTIVGDGACSITASQAGDANYAAATPVSQSFAVNLISPASQTISFGALSNVTFGVSPFTLGATASSGLAVSFASNTPLVCTVVGNLVTIVAGGSCSITARQAGNAAYGAATAVTQTFTVDAATQTITFGALSDVTFGVSPFTLGATASSGLAVGFASNTPLVCTVVGNLVTIVAGGSCSITASHAGNATYGAAAVTQSFTVNAATQTITFGAIANVAIGTTPFTVSATASSGLPVTFTSDTTSVCTVSGNTVAIVAGGFCSITASQTGNAAYGAATAVTQSFAVNLPTQTITFAAHSNVTFGVSPFTLSATASSGLAVSFASTTPSVCTVSGNTVTIVDVGVCSITASQAGNATYGAATAVTQNFSVTPASMTITTGSLPSGMVGFDYPQQILGVAGGAPPYTFAIASGGLPPGLTLAAGVIAGTPVTSGNFSFTITATDSLGAQAVASLSISVSSSTTDLVLLSGSLSFSLTTGAAATPPAQTVGVQSSDVSQVVNYTVAVSPAAPWLSVAGGGATPGSLNVALTSQALKLPVGSNQTLITMTCTSTPCAGTQSLSVSLTVTSPSPQLSVLNSLLSFTSTSTPPQAQTQQLGIQNSGGGSLTIGSIACEASWCAIGAFPASLAGGSAAQVAVTVDPAQLTPGFYRTAIDIATSAGHASVPVTFFISQTASMSLTPSGKQFAMPAGGAPGNPSGSFQVTVTGGTANWTAAVLPGASWLTLNASSGTASNSQPGNVSFSVNSSAAALTAGAYYATIAVTVSGVINSPQDFQVALNVTPSTQSETPDPQPAGLLFLTTVGGSPAPQVVTVYSGSTAPASYQAAATTDSGSWLSVASSGAASAASPDRSTVTVNAAGLAQGVYRGGVSYAFSGAGVRTVNVTLIVQPAGGSSAGVSSSPRQAVSQPSAGCAASAIVPTQTGLVGNFSMPALWPTTLAILLVNDCGAAVTNAQVVTSFTNGDPPLALSPVSGTAGLYSATWTPRQAAAQVAISTLATTTGFVAATAQIYGSVVPNSVPALAPSGVALPFNPQVGGALAPGSIVFISGSNLAGPLSQADVIPLPAILNGTSVRIGGLPAPLYYVGAGQISAQIPFELDASKQYQVVVNANGALTAPQTIQLQPATPALAAFADGSLIAQHWADNSLVSAASPAKPGEYLVMYLVGMGATDHPIASGAASPLSPLSQVTSPPTVMLGGNTVPVLFAGLTPESVGLYQIDIQAPDVPADGNLLLTVSQGGVVSNTTILPVRH